MNWPRPLSKHGIGQSERRSISCQYSIGGDIVCLRSEAYNLAKADGELTRAGSYHGTSIANQPGRRVVLTLTPQTAML